MISDYKPKADAQQSIIDQGSYLFVLAATAISLSGCAFGLQNNSVQRTPDGQVDYCSYPNIASALKEGLRKTQGGEGASLRDIVTVPINGFDKPANPHAQPSFVCRATLVQADGKSTTGRIVVSLTLEGVTPFSKINIEDITWMSDADFENKRAERAPPAPSAEPSAPPPTPQRMAPPPSSKSSTVAQGTSDLTNERSACIAAADAKYQRREEGVYGSAAIWQAERKLCSDLMMSRLIARSALMKDANCSLKLDWILRYQMIASSFDQKAMAEDRYAEICKQR